MTPLPSVSTSDVRRALERAGFTFVRSRDHIRLARGCVKVSIPHAKHQMRPSTVRNLLRQAGITPDEFVELLRR